MAPPLVVLSLLLVLAGLPAPAAAAAGCAGLRRPVHGPVVARFAPAGRYAGHWGVDFAVPVGTPVRAAAAGTVTFAGTVAGRRSVTVDHGGGLRTSYSYLDRIAVRRGARLSSGAVVGRAGLAHGRPALHWSTRFGTGYVDPLRLLRCLPPPQRALRLARRSRRSGRPDILPRCIAAFSVGRSTRRTWLTFSPARPPFATSVWTS